MEVNIKKSPHLPKVRLLGKTFKAHSSGIRITEVKSIKPPDTEEVKNQEKEKIRDQLQKEIASRSKTCLHKHYDCLLPVITGQSYCYRHILDDPKAPYKQCSQILANGERCSAATNAEFNDFRDVGLCFEHAFAALRQRMRSAAPPPPVDTTETLLTRLEHYIKPERTRTTSCASTISVVSDPGDQELSPQPLDPFKQIDATAVNAAHTASVLDCASGSDSDAEPNVAEARHEDALSDAEDAECEAAPLWHAGVFTAEEAIGEAKNTLVALRAAYLKQMDRLRVLLQMARLQYIRDVKAEKEQYCSINTQSRNGPLTVRERRQLRKLKAYASYHRKHGVDAVLARKLHHKRSKVNETSSNKPLPALARCTFTEGGVRCPNQILPAAKHCLKHILHDRHQVLFAACGDCRGCASCREVTARLPLPVRACRYHADLPPYADTQKDDTDSDSDSASTRDSRQGDVAPEHAIEEAPNVAEEMVVQETMDFESTAVE